MAFLTANHIFPEEMKSTLLGFSDILARLVCVAAPMAAELRNPYPFILFAVVSGVCGFATQFFDYNVK